MRRKCIWFTCKIWIFILAFLLTYSVYMSCMDVYASTNGHSQTDAVAMVEGLVASGWGTPGNTPNYDGSEWVPYDYGEPQCVDIIAYYMDYLLGWHYGMNATGYASITNLPEGWRYTDIPEPGDIVIWTGAPFGHIGIVTAVDNGQSLFYFVDTNGDNNALYDDSGYRHNAPATKRDPKVFSDAATFIHPDFEPNSITLNSSKEVTLKKGATYQIKVSTAGIGEVIWSTKDERVAAVSSTGEVTAKGIGTVKVIAKYGSLSVACVITVTDPKLSLSEKSITLEIGKTQKIKATVQGPTNIVKWESSNSKVATVSNQGVVKAVSSGKCEISATANGITKKCSVKVNAKKGEKKTRKTVSEKQKAMKAYSTMLSKQTVNISGKTYKTTDIYFALGYLDNDSIPEILLKFDFDSPHAILTFYNCKIKIIAFKEGLWTFSGFKKTGVYFMPEYSDGLYPGADYYLYNNGKSRKLFSLKLSYYDFSDDEEYIYYKYKYYDPKGNRINWTSFSSLYKKYTKNQCPSVFNGTRMKWEDYRTDDIYKNGAFSEGSFHRNTKANRSKYLK